MSEPDPSDVEMARLVVGHLGWFKPGVASQLRVGAKFYTAFNRRRVELELLNDPDITMNFVRVVIPPELSTTGTAVPVLVAIPHARTTNHEEP